MIEKWAQAFDGHCILDLISKFIFIQEVFQGDNERGDKENLGTSSKILNKKFD